MLEECDQGFGEDERKRSGRYKVISHFNDLKRTVIDSAMTEKIEVQ